MSDSAITAEIENQQKAYSEMSGMVWSETPDKPFVLYDYLQGSVPQMQVRCFECASKHLEVVVCGDLIGVRCPNCGHESNISYE